MDNKITEDVAKKYLTLHPQKTRQATKLDIEDFIYQAVMFNLNPFLREIHLVAYDKSDGEHISRVQVGYEVYLKRAFRANLCDGYETELTDTHCNIIVWRKGLAHPIKHSIKISEYEGKSPFWKSKKETMLRKCAISIGFRLAFSDELGGLPYTAEEFDYAEENTGAKVIVASNKVETTEVNTVIPNMEPVHGDILRTNPVSTDILQFFGNRGLNWLGDRTLIEYAYFQKFTHDLEINPYLKKLTEEEVECAISGIEKVTDMKVKTFPIDSNILESFRVVWAKIYNAELENIEDPESYTEPEPEPKEVPRVDEKTHVKGKAWKMFGKGNK